MLEADKEEAARAGGSCGGPGQVLSYFQAICGSMQLREYPSGPTSKPSQVGQENQDGKYRQKGKRGKLDKRKRLYFFRVDLMGRAEAKVLQGCHIGNNLTQEERWLLWALGTHSACL